VATSQNGWPVEGPTRSYVVPGSSVTLTLTADASAAFCLIWCCAQWNGQIEQLDAGQCGGYEVRPISGTNTWSNHASGTAVDLNSVKHPQHAFTFTEAMKAQVHWIIQQTDGVVRWGGDWTVDSLDEMHIELDTLDHQHIQDVSQKLRANNPEYGPVAGLPSSGGAALPGSPAATPATPDVLSQEIKKFPALPLTPISGKLAVSANGMLGLIRIGGSGYTSDIQDVTTSASMSYATSKVSALSVTIQDDAKGALLKSGYIGLGVPLSFGDQRMDIRTIDAANGKGGPEIRIEARSRTIFRLRTGNQVGPGTWGVVTTTTWVKDRAAEVGARAVVQPDLYELVPSRGETESTWEVFTKLAQINQCWCFEYEQTIIFGQPTWLASRKQVRAWRLAWSAHGTYTEGMDGLPTYHATVDAATPAEVESMEVLVWATTASQMRPGDLLYLQGAVGDMKGWWIITEVHLDLGGALVASAKVAAQRVINPPVVGTFDDPNNPASATSGNTATPPPPESPTGAGNTP
jgi:hypothetical protein